MRDYLVRDRSSGRVHPVAEVPTRGIHQILERIKGSGGTMELNPGVTVQAFKERLQLELFIRELGLRD